MSRPSSIYRGGTFQARRSLYLAPHDPFNLLDFREISICLQSCDFTASEELVSRPTSQYIRTLLEQILDTFMCISSENIQKGVKNVIREDRAANKSPANGSTQEEDDENNDPDDAASTLALISLHRGATEFLHTCGINDFTLMDIMRPEPQRIRRILSAIVNYARFREENSVECEKLVSLSESNLEKIRAAKAENNRLQNEISTVEQKLASGAETQAKKASLKQINAYNSKLEEELKKLKRLQEELTLSYNQYRDEKGRLIEKLEDQHYLILEAKKDIDKLKSYMHTDFDILNKVIEDLRSNLNEYQQAASSQEQRNRNINISIEAFQIIEQNIKNLFKILEEVSNDLARQNRIAEELNKHQDMLEEKKQESHEYGRQISALQRKINVNEEKTQKLREGFNRETERQQQETATLRQEYEKLSQDRATKEEELERTRKEINRYEHMINSEKNEFNIEYKNAEAAVSRLNAHVNLYISEMSKKLEPKS
ncbi:hypothetical protein PGUG_00843 [Meyerozyma guilliermondii ATCC 6260]|uniref:Uncharacterized protein n=1 Tax=Meyerozyma guilliermondii (strain ATCC 6260 / CBS 566 / DSM 6381 / JCM 1539 / NBRC 10279 / NRRL Y-324) TaxID=294746 RepID=A5DC38_PICGU|nr:uncharacterized protein PGUG_00843 [Meyerozyma guilliermondii ATCC 6260]EDK36745.2 hypothetical protein PGUG_00843 [Meyerozyma guilliermondii ATCC 6260]